MGTARLTLVIALLLSGVVACARHDDPAVRAQRRALTAERLFSPDHEDSLLAAEQHLTTGERVGRWARRFAAADSVRYLFGLAEGGYAAAGELISDRRQDCVSLLYRTSELARARDHDDAVRWALRTRFADAPLDSLVAADGRVTYDDPHHLDFSLDMIRAGHWGEDITAGLAGVRPDTVGSARYAAGSFLYVPQEDLDPTALAEGDIVWFVLSPDHAGARRLRDDHGLVIGHIGIVVREGDDVILVHAASRDLAGFYAGGTVVQVPLVEYLARVERYGGVVVTRFR